MIKLQRAKHPEYLTPSKVQELTDEFKSNKVSVWNKDQIKNPLLESSYKKCAYCECTLATESNYMEVEHFEDKNSNPDKVVEWENLLPSCKRCNSNKGGHDVNKEPIINPYNDEPKNHLSFKLYRLQAKDNKGKNTIDVLDLNNSDRTVNPRFQIGEKIHEIVRTAKERFSLYIKDKSTRNRNRVKGIIEKLLIEAQPQALYSATAATVLLNDNDFKDLVELMKKENLWSDSLESMYRCSETIILDYEKSNKLIYISSD